MEKWLELPDLPSEDEEPLPAKQQKTEQNNSMNQVHPSVQTPSRIPQNQNLYQHQMNQMNSNMNPNMNMGQNNTNMMNANQSRMPIQNPGNFGRNVPFVVPNQPGNSNCRLNLANYIQNKHGSNDNRRFPSNPPHMAMVRKTKFFYNWTQ